MDTPVALRSIVKRAGRGENTRAMPNKDVVIVILAAGKGTRLKSSRAKVLHSAGGRSLVESVVRSCVPLAPRKILAIVGHQAERSEERRVGKERRCRVWGGE